MLSQSRGKIWLGSLRHCQQEDLFVFQNTPATNDMAGRKRGRDINTAKKLIVADCRVNAPGT